MKRHASILAGTAVGLVMATAPLAYSQAPTAARPAPAGAATRSFAQPFVMAQAEPEDEEEKAKRRQREAPADKEPADGAEQSAPAGDAKPEPRPEPPAAPEQKAAPEERPAEPEPEPKAAPPADEPAPRAEPAPEAEPAPDAAPKAVEPAPRAEPEPEAAPAGREAPAEDQAPEAAPDEAAPDEPAAEPNAGQPDEGSIEEGPADESQPKQDQSEPRSAEPPARTTPEDAPRPQPAPQVAPGDEAPEPEPRPQAPAADGDDAAPAAPAEEPRAPEGGQQDGEQPDAAQPDGDQPAEAGGAPRPEGAAPVLDSQKEQAGGGETPEGDQPATGERPAGEAPADQPAEQPAEAGPPPADDSAAQEQARPIELQPVTEEQGRRIERRPEDRREERPEGAEVVREIGDRIVIRIDNRIIVESNDRPRIARGARDVYYEELPRGRIREVIVRENGVQIVTIRDRYGDVIRRSRIAPDGRETVLVYVEDDYYERVRDWRDPGRDLPPMRLTIPVEEYILDAGRVRDADAYYAFLDQPPVERVERLYSIDEVKRSARIRDKTRRVDLDTITFEFGSASIAESEIARLEGVAQAMERLLEENPAETFLIEGHTDAVGSDIANLALSDRRAEAVADALTNVFAIPPENLATQGYGEQYLKVHTGEPERENRRVAIRRITPLVAPVASAQ